MKELYLDPHQARRRQPTPFEDLLGDSIERGYAAGIEDLAAMVAHLNRTGPNCPENEGIWTEQNFQEAMARLSA
ncbi:hypothetical protein D3870_21500 [Noviherbaspirillum cavernae]|uniref:Recombinase-like domain-containing protein n=1 Tax=Noviherbaspirillum cavernae TaxID=2320862 RepID=A0A418WWM7_9BURK|nr:recombinase-like helix-turn-helix domain-containing protein [Noviherbaspirillum cavernae]RJF96941.1 hypothetical protein D3870_21500 [Noviherbaspirillum cavernae]